LAPPPRPLHCCRRKPKTPYKRTLAGVSANGEGHGQRQSATPLYGNFPIPARLMVSKDVHGQSPQNKKNAAARYAEPRHNPSLERQKFFINLLVRGKPDGAERHFEASLFEFIH
jgi:hypothetical protein